MAAAVGDILPTPPTRRSRKVSGAGGGVCWARQEGDQWSSHALLQCSLLLAPGLCGGGFFPPASWQRAGLEQGSGCSSSFGFKAVLSED